MYIWRTNCGSLLNQVTQVNMQKNAMKNSLAEEQPLQQSISLYSSGALSREVFDCSEYERAAFAISTANSRLGKLPNMVTVSSGQTALIRQLNQKCELLTESLVKRSRARLCTMYSDDNRPGMYAMMVQLGLSITFFTAYLSYYHSASKSCSLPACFSGARSWH